MRRIVLGLMLLVGVSTVSVSCREKSNKEKVEEAVEKAGDAIEDAADEVGDSIDELKEDLKDDQ